jgi:predicted HTH transcriptional regulator
MLEAIHTTCQRTLEETQNVPLKDPKNVPIKRAEQIIRLMQENKSITIERLSQLCNVSSKTIKRDIAQLKKEGKLKRIGSFKSGYWEIVATL